MTLSSSPSQSKESAENAPSVITLSYLLRGNPQYISDISKLPPLSEDAESSLGENFITLIRQTDTSKMLTHLEKLKQQGFDEINIHVQKNNISPDQAKDMATTLIKDVNSIKIALLKREITHPAAL